MNQKKLNRAVIKTFTLEKGLSDIVQEMANNNGITWSHQANLLLRQALNIKLKKEKNDE